MVAWMAVYAGASATFLIGDFVYHRWIKKPEIEKAKPQEIAIARTDDGAAIPIIIGRGRIRGPVLVWHSAPTSAAGSVGNGYPDGTFVYKMDMFLKLGIGMKDGDGEHQLHGMWAGEKKFSMAPAAANTALAQAEISTFGEEGTVGGQYQWYDGNSSQEHVNSGGTAVTALGMRMLTDWPAAQIAGFRGYISVLLTNNVDAWYIGSQPSVQQYSFEVSSYYTGSDYPASAVYARIGPDSNPINALFDILRSYFGRLGMPLDVIDIDSFTAAAITLYQESHGYSRVIEDSRDGTEYIQEILEQIDAAMYFDWHTGKLKIKLVRNDYDVRDLPHLTRANAELEHFSMSGWSGLVNAFRLGFTDRERDYGDGSIVAKNSAQAVGQGGMVRWMQRTFPGVTNEDLAHRLAWRELHAVSRPMAKMRMLLDRSLAGLNPGDAVRVTYTNPDLSEVVFRVASVDRGTLEDGKIAVDLIQDSFYVYRRLPPQPPGLVWPDAPPPIVIAPPPIMD
jgi:hypothetical protein